MVVYSGLNNFALRDSIHQFAIRFEKVISVQFAARRPFDSLKDSVLDPTAIRPDQKENHFNIPVWVAMAQAKDLLAYFGLN